MRTRHASFRALWAILTLSSLGCTQLKKDASDAGPKDKDANVSDASQDALGDHDAGDAASTEDAEPTNHDAGPDDGQVIVDDGYTPEELCTDLRTAVCAAERVFMDDPDFACDHLNYQHLDEMCRALPLLVASGKVDYDEVAAKACVEKHLPATEGMDPPWPPPLAQLACQDVTKGNVALGGTCYTEAILYFGSECSEGYCKRAGGQCPGTCSTYLEVGDDCDVYISRCDPKDYCAYGTNVCARCCR